MQPAPRRDSTDLAGDGLFLADLRDSEEAERRHVRWAFAIAVALHLALFSLHLPEIAAQVHAPPDKSVFVVKPTPYMPPEPKPRETLPRELPIKVPVPDPTPDEPEPLTAPAEIEVDSDLPVTYEGLSFPEPPPEPEPERTLVVGGEVEPPVKIYAPPPRYTEMARKARIEGRVIVSAVIDKEGRVVEAKILAPLSMSLDQAAIDAIRTWTFEPATLRGEPVAVFYTLTVHFTLN